MYVGFGLRPGVFWRTIFALSAHQGCHLQYCRPQHGLLVVKTQLLWKVMQIVVSSLTEIYTRHFLKKKLLYRYFFMHDIFHFVAFFASASLVRIFFPRKEFFSSMEDIRCFLSFHIFIFYLKDTWFYLSHVSHMSSKHVYFRYQNWVLGHSTYFLFQLPLYEKNPTLSQELFWIQASELFTRSGWKENSTTIQFLISVHRQATLLIHTPHCDLPCTVRSVFVLDLVSIRYM